ncbi:hypothetical protein DL98DRAFT_132937 [Cadophora sp. DSE1049]|nr:hypothetical protein DL98DRAFT_132937 [Cadophora sp. DSE1049]
MLDKEAQSSDQRLAIPDLGRISIDFAWIYWGWQGCAFYHSHVHRDDDRLLFLVCTSLLVLEPYEYLSLTILHQAFIPLQKLLLI